MKRPRTVARLLSTAFGVLVLLILLSGSAGLAASALQHSSVRTLNDHVVPMRLANTHLRVVLGDAQRALRGYLLTGDPQLLRVHDTAKDSYAPALEELLGLATTPGERVAIIEQDTRAQRWWWLASVQRGAVPRSDEAARLSERGRLLFDPILAANDVLDADLARQGDALNKRSEALRTGMLTSMILLTGLAGLLAALTAVRTTARITRPLRRLVGVLGRLGAGERDARAPVEVDVTEIGAVADAVNRMLDEADRVRKAEAELARLGAAARDLGVRVRQHLSVDAVLDEAAAGLGELLSADHTVIRLSRRNGGRAPVARWRRDDAPGGTDALAALDVGWLTGGVGEHMWVATDVRADPYPVPPEERRALLAAEAGAAITLGFDTGSGPAGAVTLVRCRAGMPWTQPEVQAAESVTADLGRGVLQAELYEREQELVARLRDLDNAKTDFMSTVSHELRTPLTSIAGYLEMLRDGDGGQLSKGQERMLAVIERNTSRLRVLIEDLLVLSRIESGTFKTNRQDMDFGWLVGAAVSAVTPAAAAAGVMVETELGPGLGGYADPDQIDRVMMNLLSNAIKFTPQGGHIEVGAHRKGDEIVICVSDTGMGIPEADQRHLFNRFFRASNATEQAIPGTGLGLAIVRTIVANHGGDIAVASRDGGGTTFTVRLPS